jgi:choice-of-anchor A domain-containing protein
MKIVLSLVAAVFATQANGLACPPLSYFGHTLNAFFPSDFTAPSSDTQGALAVGGNFDVKQYSIGDEDLSDYHQDILYVQGTCSWETGMIVGNAKCGAIDISEVVNNSFNAIPSEISIFTDEINFDQEFNFYQTAMSEIVAMGPARPIEGDLAYGAGAFTDLAKKQASEEASQETAQKAKLGIADAQGSGLLAVFELSCTQLNTYHSIQVKNVAESTSVVFKITGDDNCKLSNINFLGQPDFTKNIFVFPDATQLLISETSVPGSVLATGAAITAESGEVNGQVVGVSWNGMTQINYFPWGYCG